MRILVFGTFDHLHPGHRFLLAKAAELGEIFVVVAHNDTVQSLKGFLPDQTQEERMRVLQEEFTSATVLPGGVGDYLAPVQSVNPDLILLGYDQQMPPGVFEEGLPCPVRRIEAFMPEKYKSSYMRKRGVE